jgi:ferritin-like metal-binding protein YciE
MKIDSLDTLLTEELRDIYDAEKQITKALPKMAKAARSDELKEALQEHLEVTRGQIARLEEIFGILEEKPKSRPCAGMKGIIQEGSEMMQFDKRGSDEHLTDAAIISTAQRVEHYEIAVYGTLRTYAERLGNNRVARLLEQTKREEAEADRRLSQISEELLSMEGSQEESSEENGSRRTRANGDSTQRGRASGRSRRT